MTYLEQLTNTKPTRAKNMAEGIAPMILQIRKENIKQSLSDMETIRHRQDYVATVNEVMYYDDSKAESVNATWFTLESIIKPVIWIAEGDNRSADFSDLKATAKKNVKVLICLGKGNLKKTFKNDVNEILEAESIEEAVAMASRLAQEEDIVLFSPAGRPATHAESNEQRGNRYIESVKQLENERHQ